MAINLKPKPLRIAIIGLLMTGSIVAQKVAPTANDDTYTVGLNTPLNVSAANGLLANDTDPNVGTVLQVHTTPITAPGSGSVSLNADGSFTFTPNTGFIGTDSFTYRVCDDGTPNAVVSQFDFDTPALTTAAIGPNATSINPDATQTGCGVHIPSGLTGGGVGLDMVIPNTGNIFGFTSFSVAIEYRDQESTADIVTAGNFRIWHIGGNTLGIQLTVINGATGLPQTYVQSLGNFISGNVPYTIAYNELTGEIVYTANGTVTTFNVAPPFSPLDSSLAADIRVGLLMDNSGSALPSLCSVAFMDTSILCSDATVTLNVQATLITNRRITYRVNPN